MKSPMPETIVWLGTGVYIRASGVWRHRSTCPSLTALDYATTYFAIPPATMRIYDAAAEISNTLCGMSLPCASAYADLTEHQIKILAAICRRRGIPHHYISQTYKRGCLRKSVTLYAFAAPFNVLLK